MSRVPLSERLCVRVCMEVQHLTHDLLMVAGDKETLGAPGGQSCMLHLPGL